jgi:CubicO group peptidase (beta-lactamase class C family)
MRVLARLIASVALLPVLASCSSASDAPPPASREALEAIAQKPGTNRENLARAVDALFTDSALGQTQAVIVMHRGLIVAERYAPGYTGKTRFLGWSMSKTVTAVAIGLLAAEGRLELDEAPPIRHWLRSGDPRGEITLRQLLQMRSGLRHEERAEREYKGDTVRMLFLDGHDNMAGWAEAQPLETEPGRKFEYSTATSVILSDVIARVLAPDASAARRREAVAEFMHGQLFEPAGLHSMVPEFDRAGTMIGGAMIHATARDWARFGEFLRHKGAVKGVQVIPRRWIEFMAQPSPRARDYGAQLWLNRNSGTDRDMLFAGKAPSSIYAAIGHNGQYLIVSPDQQLTVLRLGATRDEDRPALQAALARVVRLY